MIFKNSDDITHAALYMIPDHHQWIPYAADFFYNDEWGSHECVDAVASSLIKAEGKAIYRIKHRDGAYCFVGNKAEIISSLKKLEELITWAEEADAETDKSDNVSNLLNRLDRGETIEDIYDEREV